MLVLVLLSAEVWRLMEPRAVWRDWRDWRDWHPHWPWHCSHQTARASTAVTLATRKYKQQLTNIRLQTALKITAVAELRSFLTMMFLLYWEGGRDGGWVSVTEVLRQNRLQMRPAGNKPPITNMKMLTFKYSQKTELLTNFSLYIIYQIM